MRVMYRYGDGLSVSCFDDVYYDDSSSYLTFQSLGHNQLRFSIPYASAIIALTKLLLDGYVDLQSFCCELF